MSLHAALAAAAFLGAASVVDALTNVHIKACAPNEEQLLSCKQMLTLNSFQYECATEEGNAEDGQECFIHECIKSDDCGRAVVEGNADWAMSDPLMLYLVNEAVEGTGREIAPIAYEQRSGAADRGTDAGTGQGSDFRAVFLLREETCRMSNAQLSIDSTRNWKSCHTRYGDLASWAFPVYRLMELGLADGDSDTEVISSFYQASCAPSNSDEELCSACVHRERCDLDDPFAGNDGVIDCLRTEAGDIAFMDHFNAERAQADPSTRDDFRLLCTDGCQPISMNSRPGCYWGEIPADVAFLREDNPYAGYIQWVVTNMHKDSDKFERMFGGSQHNKFLSPHTVKVAKYEGEGVAAYIGPLKEMLDAFSAAAASGGNAAQQAADAAAVTAEARSTGSSGKKGTPAWGVALTFFAALVAGLAGGMFIQKLRKPKSVDTFYQGDMDLANGGLPNTDPRMRDGSDPDSPLNGGFPDTSDLPMPPALRR